MKDLFKRYSRKSLDYSNVEESVETVKCKGYSSVGSDQLTFDKIMAILNADTISSKPSNRIYRTRNFDVRTRTETKHYTFTLKKRVCVESINDKTITLPYGFRV